MDKQILVLIMSGFGVIEFALISILLILFSENQLSLFEFQVQILICIFGATYFALEFLKVWGRGK